MRFTQLGHQVPRKNSTITGPRLSSACRLMFSALFAAERVKSGARSPTFRVSLVSLSLMADYGTRILRGVQRKSKINSFTTDFTDGTDWTIRIYHQCHFTHPSAVQG